MLNYIKINIKLNRNIKPIIIYDLNIYIFIYVLYTSYNMITVIWKET